MGVSPCEDLDGVFSCLAQVATATSSSSAQHGHHRRRADVPGSHTAAGQPDLQRPPQSASLEICPAIGADGVCQPAQKALAGLWP
eukprot:3745523-Amphidinium_carterae.1